QAWFAGVHTNVGGGYVDSGLSDHSFMWMAIKAIAAGLKLQPLYLAMRVDPNAHGELRDSIVSYYKLLPKQNRQLARADTLNEKIHQSALTRMKHPTNTYRPVNLTKGLSVGVPVSADGLSEIAQIRAAIYPGLT